MVGIVVVAQILDVLYSLGVIINVNLEKSLREADPQVGKESSDMGWKIYDSASILVNAMPMLPILVLVGLATVVAIALRRG